MAIRPLVSFKSKNAWQSLAYSLLGVAVSPLASTNEKHLLTDRRIEVLTKTATPFHVQCYWHHKTITPS